MTQHGLSRTFTLESMMILFYIPAPVITSISLPFRRLSDWPSRLDEILKPSLFGSF